MAAGGALSAAAGLPAAKLAVAALLASAAGCVRPRRNFLLLLVVFRAHVRTSLRLPSPPAASRPFRSSFFMDTGHHFSSSDSFPAAPPLRPLGRYAGSALDRRHAAAGTSSSSPAPSAVAAAGPMEEENMKTKRIYAVAIALCLAATAFGQTPTFPAIPLPTAIAAFGAFNQLGSPRFTMGVSAIYPVVGSLGLYGTTTSDIFPKLATDPTTKRNFYAISASIRQGVHEDLLNTGRFSFLLGGDVGPGFSQAQPSGINVNLSTSFVATTLYQINPTFSLIVPVRMLYVSGAGWNPVVEAGIVVNLKNLPKVKP